MDLIGIDKAKACDYTSVTFINGSEIKASNNNDVVRGLRRNLKLYDDYCDLERLGIPIMDNKCEYRSLSDILVDLSKKINSIYRSDKYKSE
ncbi:MULTISPECIES: hypothetical protein [unclassified Clostridium]|uniref:hypothetical protein n=1 Tax=unclassified Clostridium TaxID=2614128 RepID=UPI002079730C|nr:MULTISPECIES: hypothetical protein [unclassified Clostridium]